MDHLDEYDWVQDPADYHLGEHDDIDGSDVEREIVLDQLMTDIAEAEDTDSSGDVDETGGVSFVGSWDNDEADNNSSRSSSPPDSTGLLSSPPPQPQRYLYDNYDEDEEDQEDQEDHGDGAHSIDLVLSSPEPEEDEVLFVDEQEEEEPEEEEDDPLSAALREHMDQWQQNHQNLVESGRRVTETLREIREQERPQNHSLSRFWQDALGDSGNTTSTAPSSSRQHPYRRPRSHDMDSSQARRSDRRRNSGQQANPPDELVAVEVEGPRRQTSARRRTQEAGGRARTESRTQQVIDLTGEPDSPEAPRRNPNTLFLPRHGMPSLNIPRPGTSSTSGHNHRRRQMPPNNHPPSLSRSNVVSNVVIDLTGDDDPSPARTTRQGVRPPLPLPRVPRATIPPHVQPVDLEEEERSNRILGFGVLAGNIRRFFLPSGPAILTEFTIRNPLGNNLPDLNYQANGWNNGGRGGSSNKPAHVPPPKAREGFTRNTSSGGGGNSDEADVFVCPACEEELAYDPDEGGGPGAPGKNGPPTKKARTKKDREEHYFWAVKECGHVFCKKCFETRSKRTSTKTHDRSKFELDVSPSKKVYCPVESCQSEVSKSSAWVGLFL